MTIKQTNDGAAVVDTKHFWIPIEKQAPPHGAKVLLINKRWGVAVLGIYKPTHNWTHWAGLPKFPEDL